MLKKLLLTVAVLFSMSSMNFAFAAAEIDVNSATQAQLESIIPGDATAKKQDAAQIIKLREQGRFKSNDDFVARLSTHFKPRVIKQLTDSGAVVKN